jgi:hypothetical protein
MRLLHGRRAAPAQISAVGGRENYWAGEAGVVEGLTPYMALKLEVLA